MTIIILKIILFAALLAILGFFNGAETAVTSLSGAYLRRAKEKCAKNYSYIIFWETHSDEIMTTMMIGMNLSLVGMGVVVSSLASDIMENYGFQNGYLRIIFPALSIVLALIFGNIFPKTFARYNCEKTGLIVLPAVIKISKVFKLLNILLSSISNRILKELFKKKVIRSVEADEIDFLLSNKNTSPLPDDSRELVSNIMNFSERRISQVMVPRSEIFAVNLDDGKENLIKQIIETEFSRVPVYRGNLNNIVGIIYSKDLAVAWRSSDIIVIEDLIRTVHYVPENAKVSKILKGFKTGHHHISIVVDEFGSTIGIVSIEDLIEEIVGEVWDEYDESDMNEKTIVALNDSSYLVQASEAIANLNDKLNLNIPEVDYATVNGWVLEIFGDIPQTGEKAQWENIEIEIQDADVKQINRIILRRK
ncbi:MAG: hemolysin family protein [Endomicrobium sp.]|jgi:CBS domain containing-hemolysin-like protein|nr:hemolysin family protein [Endomicrobium sp.]